MKQFAGYLIAKNYRSVEIAFYNQATRSRTSTLKVTPKPSLNRRQRYEVIRDALTGCDLIGFAPSFQPSQKPENPQ
jgi:hypothetical protein